jgi:hypothetical protein
MACSKCLASAPRLGQLGDTVYLPSSSTMFYGIVGVVALYGAYRFWLHHKKLNAREKSLLEGLGSCKGMCSKRYGRGVTNEAQVQKVYLASANRAAKMSDEELASAIRRYDVEVDPVNTPRFKFPKAGQARALSLSAWRVKLARGQALYHERAKRAKR